jgi:hypothetical protein
MRTAIISTSAEAHLERQITMYMARSIPSSEPIKRSAQALRSYLKLSEITQAFGVSGRARNIRLTYLVDRYELLYDQLDVERRIDLDFQLAAELAITARPCLSVIPGKESTP